MFVPSDGIYQAALAAGPRADRVRSPAAGADGNADHADRPAVGRPLRLAPGADRGVGARDRRVRARAAQPARALRRTAGEGRSPARLRRRRLQRGGRLLRRPRDPTGTQDRAGRRGLRPQGARAGGRGDHGAGDHGAAGARGRMPLRRQRSSRRSFRSRRGSEPAHEHDHDQRARHRHRRRQLVDEEEQQVERQREDRGERRRAQLRRSDRASQRAARRARRR